MKKLIYGGFVVLIFVTITILIFIINSSKLPGNDELIERATTVFVAQNTPEGFVVGEVLLEGADKLHGLVSGERVAMLGDSRWAGRPDGPREVVVILWREHGDAAMGRGEIPILEDGKLLASRRTKADLVRELSRRRQQ